MLGATGCFSSYKQTVTDSGSSCFLLQHKDVVFYALMHIYSSCPSLALKVILSFHFVVCFGTVNTFLIQRTLRIINGPTQIYLNQTSQEQERREREELDRMLEENRRKVEEAQRKVALEQEQKELERYLELERIQKQREEALRRKKMEEEEERANKLRLLGKNRG